MAKKKDIEESGKKAAAEKKAAVKAEEDMAAKDAAAEQESESQDKTEQEDSAEKNDTAPTQATDNADQPADSAVEENPKKPAKDAAAPSKAEKAARQIFSDYPDAREVYVTSDGFGFFKQSDARNHAATLREKTVVTVKRK